MHILLTGLSGAGKSTVGRLLAESLGRPFVDLDVRIAERAGMDVGSIFENLGEAQFRQMEARALYEACAAEPRVIACGGGALVSVANRDLARRSGRLVWLEVTPETAARRCAASEERPLIGGADPAGQLRRLLTERRDTYSEADIRVGTDGRTPAEVARAVIEALATLGERE